METRDRGFWLISTLEKCDPDLGERFAKAREFVVKDLLSLRRLPEASDHRPEHTMTVLHYLGHLIPHDIPEPLSTAEKFYLLVASELYDYGVLLGRSDIKYSFDIPIDYYNQTREYIINNRSSLGLSVHEARIVGEICRAYAMPSLEYLRGIEFSLQLYGTVRVPLLAVFLRLADLISRLNMQPRQSQLDDPTGDQQILRNSGLSECISDIQIETSPSWDIRLITHPNNEQDEEQLYAIQNDAQKELDILYPVLRASGVFFKKIEMVLNRDYADREVRARKNPFLLLRHFTSRTAHLFAGRAKETQLVIQKIMGRKLIVLIGESGVGKTSLVEAGIIPKLKAYNFKVLRFSFQEDPIESLTKELRKLTEGRCKSSIPVDILSYYYQLSKKNPRLLLIGDHLEQMFTIHKSRQAKARFVQNVARILGGAYPTTFLFCIREDYLPDLYNLSLELPDLYARDNTFRLHRLSKENGIVVLKKASEHASVELSAKLIKKIAGDLCYEGAGAIYPPFLQIVGYRLYLAHNRRRRKYGDENAIKQSLYRDLGAVEAIVNQYLDGLLDQYQHEDKPIVGQILSTMVTEYYTKKRVTKEDLQQALPGCHNLEKLLSSLVQQRIVRRSLGEYELVHDFLARRVIEYVKKRKFLSPPVRKAIKFMEDNYSRATLTSMGIAKAAHVSSIHLAALFRQQLKRSTNRQLNEIRIAKAKEMLRGRDRLGVIAKNCGFSCLSTFSRKFKQIEGMSPLEYHKDYMTDYQ